MLWPLVKVLRNSHCFSTHQFFAVDAIPLVQTDAGKRLARILLRHHDRYLAGAIDPDVRFRDFQNHVIHVTEGYWGGAPRVAHAWYDRLQKYLRTNRYGDAAHAAGVLSHYFTDVLQPLHTEIGPTERVLHGPFECSVRENYRRIYQNWAANELRVVFQLSGGQGWLGEAMLHAARFAHRKRRFLLNDYDLGKAVNDPRDGLTNDSIEELSELFGLAITGLARIFERAAYDAEATRKKRLPRKFLSLPTALATVDVPLQFWKTWMESRLERADAIALLEEFRGTGDLVDNLPAEVDVTHRVVKVYHDEQRWSERRQQSLDSKQTVVTIEDSQSEEQPSPATVPFQERKQPAANGLRRSA